MTNTSEKIRLVIADDHAILRRGLEYTFSHEKDFLLLCSLANGKELVEAVEEHRPNVVLTDIRMPHMNGLEACAAIRKISPKTAIIIYSGYDSADLVRQMRGIGVRGYLVKDGSDSEVCTAVRVVYSGGEYYSSSIQERASQFFRSGSFNQGVVEKKECFTNKELQIIGLICREQSTKEIADEIKMKTRTVEYHKKEIEEKMGVRGVVGIAVYAVQNWLLY